MPEQPASPSRGLRVVSAAAFGLVLAVLGGMALAQQDKYTLKVPGGLAFSEFRGYEGWQVVAISQNDKLKQFPADLNRWDSQQSRNE